MEKTPDYSQDLQIVQPTAVLDESEDLRLLKQNVQEVFEKVVNDVVILGILVVLESLALLSKENETAYTFLLLSTFQALISVRSIRKFNKISSDYYQKELMFLKALSIFHREK